MRDYHLVVPSDRVASNTGEKTDYAFRQIAQVLKGEVPHRPRIVAVLHRRDDLNRS